jgi:hypothetical protein
MSKSTDVLVVNAYLTTVRFAQRLTQAQHRSLVRNLQLRNTPFQVAPYSQKLQRKLKAQSAAYYANPNYQVQL